MLLVACPKPESGNEKSFSEFCTKVNVALGTYFALTALFGISRQKPGPAYLAQAYGGGPTRLWNTAIMIRLCGSLFTESRMRNSTSRPSGSLTSIF